MIDHCPWPSSQFNKWHAQNKLLSSSLIVIGSSPGSLPLKPANHCRRKARLILSYLSFQFSGMCGYYDGNAGHPGDLRNPDGTIYTGNTHEHLRQWK
jgi:hypothetical protein